MKNPSQFYSMKQGKLIRFDELSLEEVCLELEFFIWYFRDDPVNLESWENDSEQEILDCLHLCLFRFTRTKKMVKIPRKRHEKSADVYLALNVQMPVIGTQRSNR